MSKLPLVSIVIPVYNGGNYLKEAVDSALNQTYRNIEILVVNDGSKDDGKTEAIALSYGDKIRYLKKENGGVASALNMGIRNMKGEYFSWLSHDDLYYPEKIEKEMQAVQSLADKTTVVQCEYDFYDMASGSLTTTNFHKYYTLEQITNSVFSVLQLQIHACGALIHRDNFTRAGCFDETIYTVQDIELWFRMLRNRKSCFVPEALFRVREHAAAGSRTIPSYYAETCALYIRLIKKMSLTEMERVFGSAWRFLVRMIAFIKSYNGDTSEIEKRLAECSPNDSDNRNRKILAEKLQKNRKRIVIFGAGQYGVRMHYELLKRGIEAELFLDNSTEKNQKIIDGLPCQLPETVLDDKDNIMVVVALRNCQSALEQLQKLGFTNIIIRQEIDGILTDRSRKQVKV